MRYFAANKAEVASAGVETHGLNPRAVATMKKAGVDISTHQSDLVDRYMNEVWDYIITVCDHAKETCPHIPSDAERIHHTFTDPSKLDGSEEEIQQAFWNTCMEIKAYCNKFVEDHLS